MAPPLILIRGDDSVVSAAAQELRETGWVVRDGWSVPDGAWDLKRLVCAGVVRGPGDAGAVVLAAARGAGIVAGRATESAVVEGLYEDLRRLGRVEWRSEVTDSPGRLLTDEQVQMLKMLGAGASLDDLARELNYSRRTTTRRLAEARAALGVQTNAEAVRVISRNLEGRL
jgi:DNA-binding CsgD family transcriptional regulator